MSSTASFGNCGQCGRALDGGFAIFYGGIPLCALCYSKHASPHVVAGRPCTCPSCAAKDARIADLERERAALNTRVAELFRERDEARRHAQGYSDSHESVLRALKERTAERDERSSAAEQAERDLAAARAEVAMMRLYYDECAQCQASLLMPRLPPHCEDCNVDDEHERVWSEAVGDARDRLDAATRGEKGGGHG